MKKLCVAFLFLFPATCFSATEVKEVARDWIFSTTSVSTTNVTALPATAYSGRYKITCENTDPTWSVSIGTHSAMTFANGFTVLFATSTNNTVTLPLPSGKSIFALGQSNAASSTVNVRCFEYK